MPEIKLKKWLPNLTPEEEAIFNEAIMEVYLRGKADAIKWIPVTERLPQNFVSVLGYMTDAGEFPPVRECYTVGNAFYFPALQDRHPVSHWAEIPQPQKGE